MRDFEDLNNVFRLNQIDARKPLSGQAKRGVFASIKNRNGINWCRPVDKEFMSILEADPDVVRFGIGPKITLVIAQKKVTHQVAFRVETKTKGSVFIDIISRPGKKDEPSFGAFRMACFVTQVGCGFLTI